MSSSISATAAVVTTTAPTVSVGVSPTAVSESGASSLTYTFTRSGDLSKELTVDIGVSGTATESDYTDKSGTPWPWTTLLGSISGDQTYALTTGLDGSIYVSGGTEGPFDGQTYSGGYADAFLIKYNPDASKAWTKLLGSSGSDLATALTTGLDGSIYVSGYTSGTLDEQANSCCR